MSQVLYKCGIKEARDEKKKKKSMVLTSKIHMYNFIHTQKSQNYDS